MTSFTECWSFEWISGVDYIKLISTGTEIIALASCWGYLYCRKSYSFERFFINQTWTEAWKNIMLRCAVGHGFFYETDYFEHEGGGNYLCRIYPDFFSDITCYPEFPNHPIITWTIGHRLYVAQVSLRPYQDHIANLKSYIFQTRYFPSIHYVEDTLGNANFLLSSFTRGLADLETRFLFLDIGIDEYDDLPK